VRGRLSHGAASRSWHLTCSASLILGQVRWQIRDRTGCRQVHLWFERERGLLLLTLELDPVAKAPGYRSTTR
jgi:hypothetical protein